MQKERLFVAIQRLSLIGANLCVSILWLNSYDYFLESVSPFKVNVVDYLNFKRKAIFMIDNKVKFIKINSELAGQRVDNYLLRLLKNVPKSRIYKMLRKGEVRINKKRIDQLYRLQQGDEIRIPPYWSDVTPKPATPKQQLIELLTERIIYEDNALLVINKPSGIAAHGGSGINFGAIEIMRFARPDLKNLELVHRLDRDTSGCMVFAKKRSMLRTLHALIREGKVKKRYLVLVKGKWEGGEKLVDVPLQKNQLLSGERVVKVNQEGKPSLTLFRPLQTSAQASLLEVELYTGRTHQIRVHAASIGYPVAGDEKYGDKEFNNAMKAHGLKRLFLHAAKIEFQVPDGKQFTFQAVLDPDLADVLVVIFATH